MSLLIGITMLVAEEKKYNEQRDAISREWFSFIGEALPGAVVAPLPNNRAKSLELGKKLKMDMLILSGGNDIGSVPVRDETENLLISDCLKNDIPVLGICRGMQLLNLFFGGILNRDIYKASNEKHVKRDHKIRLEGITSEPSSSKRDIKVNSFHNHGVMEDGISKELEVFARTDKGVVEGFNHKSKPVVGIQWHPERRNPSKDFDLMLIRKFLKGTLFI